MALHVVVCVLYRYYLRHSLSEYAPARGDERSHSDQKTVLCTRVAHVPVYARDIFLGRFRDFAPRPFPRGGPYPVDTVFRRRCMYVFDILRLYNNVIAFI